MQSGVSFVRCTYEDLCSSTCVIVLMSHDDCEACPEQGLVDHVLSRFGILRMSPTQNRWDFGRLSGLLLAFK